MRYSAASFHFCGYWLLQFNSVESELSFARVTVADPCLADLPEMAATSTPPSSFGSPFFQQTSDGLEPPSSGRSGLSQKSLLSSKTVNHEYYQANFATQPGTADSSPVVIGSPPIDIPRTNRRDMGMFLGSSKPVLTAGFTTTSRSTSRGEDFNHDILDGLRGGKGSLSSDPSMDGQLGHMMAQIVPSSPENESLAATNRQFDNLAVQESNGIQHMDSGVVANGKAPWDMMSVVDAPCSQAIGNGTLSHGLQSGGSSASKSTSNPEFEPAFLFDHGRNHGSSGVVSDSTLDGSPLHEDLNTGEDAESLDAHSKSEDNEGAEQADDVWEGAMFPFCEEGELLEHKKACMVSGMNMFFLLKLYDSVAKSERVLSWHEVVANKLNYLKLVLR